MTAARRVPRIANDDFMEEEPEEEEDKNGYKEGHESIPLDLQFTAPSTRANSNPLNLLKGKPPPVHGGELRRALERVASTERKQRESSEKTRTKRVYTRFIKESRQGLLVHINSVTNPEEVVIRGQPKTLRRGSLYDAEDFRGSRFRGVSKNKEKWQVMVTLYHRKEYKGGIESETEAARLYDRRSILTYGLKAKTNFDYTRRELEEILHDDEEFDE